MCIYTYIHMICIYIHDIYIYIYAYSYIYIYEGCAYIHIYTWYVYIYIYGICYMYIYICIHKMAAGVLVQNTYIQVIIRQSCSTLSGLFDHDARSRLHSYVLVDRHHMTGACRHQSKLCFRVGNRI